MSIREAQRPSAPAAVEPHTVAPVRTRRIAPIIAALAVSLVPATYIARIGSWLGRDGRTHWSLFDDAMISMSYARTFASGHGLVWYPGAPKVEGITNLGWTLVMALVHAVGLEGDSAVVAVKLLGLITVWLAAVVGCAIARACSASETSTARFVVTLAVAGNIPLLFWAISGMEVGVLTLFTLVACLLAWRVQQDDDRSRVHLVALGVVLAAGVVVRFDFAVVGVALVVWAALTRRPRVRVLASVVLGAIALSIVATVAFRLAYYGDPLPNTYYLKLTGVSPLLRVERGSVVAAATCLGYVVPSLIVIGWLWRKVSAPQRRLVGLLLTVAAGQVLYSVSVGGDAWERYDLPNRYLTPAVVCCVLAACCTAFAAVDARFVSDARRLARWWPALLVATLAVLGPLVMAMVTALGGQETRLGLSGDVGGALEASAIALLAGLAVIVLVVWSARQGRIGRSAAVAAGVCGLLLVGLAPAIVRQTHDADLDGGSASFARVGDALSEYTKPGASIAMTGVGASQYFSGRPFVDLLGKNDRHIAHGAPATEVFFPGHNKWDVAWSLGHLHPDVVYGGVAAADLRRFGYVEMEPRSGEFPGGSFYVRKGSPNVRIGALRPVTEAG